MIDDEAGCRFRQLVPAPTCVARRDNRIVAYVYCCLLPRARGMLMGVP